jgi:hypothetical protein
MTPMTTDPQKDAAEDTMSKLVGALLMELADEVPDKPGFESIRADLLAACKVYEYGKKRDLVLRFYLAIRSLFHELKRLEKLEAARSREMGQSTDAGQGMPQYAQEPHQTYPSSQ